MKRLGLILLCAALALLAVANPHPVQAAAGDLDRSFAGFGIGGQVITTGLPAGPNSIRGMALQPDGRIVVAGVYDKPVLGGTVREAFVARYLSNGQLDIAFGGGDGIATFAKPGTTPTGGRVALQPDGKVVVALQSTPDFLLARLTATGALDSSFDGDGWVTTDFAGSGDSAYAVLVQPDGKIVAAGAASVGGDDDFAIARYCANGSLDNGANCGPGGFGGDGKVTIGFGGDEAAYAAALQDDGKLVVAGYSHCCTIMPDSDFAVARLNADGSLDDGFDMDGKTTSGFGGDEFATAVAIQPDGKIVAAGHGGGSVRVARYLTSGLPDNGFDGDGKLSIGSLSGSLSAAVVQTDSKLVLLGYHKSPDNDNKFALYRLNTDASLDATFELDGIAYVDVGGDDRGYALALQPDGRILAYGAMSSSQALLRFWPDGTLDAGGQQTLGFADPAFGPRSNEQALAMATQADGKIVLAGQIADAGAGDVDFALARFLPDGRPDTTFGTDGRVTYGFGGDQFARAVAIQPADGKIVVGGYTSAANGINFMLARFNPDGTPDGSFGFGGFNVLDFLGGTDYAVALSLAPDGKIVLAGPAFNGARTVFGVARFNTNGTPDLDFDGDGKTLYEFSVGPTHYASAVVVQPDKKIVLAGFVGGDFALVRLTEAGLVDTSFGTFPDGHTLTDLGGGDYLYALLLTPANTFVAAGYRVLGPNADFALAQYDANGVLAVPGPHQHWDKLFIDFGGVDTAYALDYRADGQILVAGCTEGAGVVWAQMPIQSGIFSPLKGGTDFVGSGECAYSAKFSGRNKLLTAGLQNFSDDVNFALARFETTVDATLPPLRELFLPLIAR